jgi:hypothetical protein
MIKMVIINNNGDINDDDAVNDDDDDDDDDIYARPDLLNISMYAMLIIMLLI